MGSLGWKVLGTGSAVLAGALATRAVNLAWKAVTGNDPPTVPEDPDTGWAEAIGWAMLSGAVLGLARLAAVRRAAMYYRESTGHLPKAIRRDA